MSAASGLSTHIIQIGTSDCSATDSADMKNLQARHGKDNAVHEHVVVQGVTKHLRSEIDHFAFQA